MPQSAEPIVYAPDMLVADMQHSPRARMQESPAYGPADQIAKCDAASAARQRAENCGDQVQAPLEDQDPQPVSKNSSGTGKPTRPTNSKEKMAT